MFSIITNIVQAALITILILPIFQDPFQGTFVTNSALRATTTARPGPDHLQPSCRPAQTDLSATDNTIPPTEKTFTGFRATTVARCRAAQSSGYPHTPLVHKIAIRIQIFRWDREEMNNSLGTSGNDLSKEVSIAWPKLLFIYFF